MVVYPEGVWYRIEDPVRDVEDIVTEHIVGGKPVARLMLPPREEDPYGPRPTEPDAEGAG